MTTEMMGYGYFYDFNIKKVMTWQNFLRKIFGGLKKNIILKQ